MTCIEKNSMYLSFTNLLFAIFSLVSIFHTVPVICQRLQPFEMLQIIESEDYPEITNSDETKKCLPTITGDYHPEIHYEYSICDSSSVLMGEEIYYVYEVNKTACKGYQCWESVLTDASKLAILDIFNSYRQTVARGTCGSKCDRNKERLIFRLIWEYPAEFEAASRLKSCSTREAPSAKTPYASWIYDRLKKEVNKGEYFHVTFQVQTGFQSELLAKLKKILNMEKDYLSDWNTKTHQFRRGLANTIGCAYLLLYGVTMKTDLDEDVKSGNVAIFACFISAFFSEKENYPFEFHLPGTEATISTPENCAKVVNAAIMKPTALYPSLCMVEIDVKLTSSPWMICQPDIKYHGDLYQNVCKGFNSERNPETWNEKPYGYIIRWSGKKMNNREIRVPSPECNIPEFTDTPKPNIDENQALDFNCTREYKVSSTTASEMCSGKSCDDSQLTDETRKNVLHSLNRARHQVAQGKFSDLCRSPCQLNSAKSYCNVVALRWHWYLESKALERVQNCPTQYDSRKTHYDNSPFQEPVFYEEVSLIFELPEDGQIKLRDEISKIFWSNGLNDWNTDGTFRRSNAAFIGCAIVIRPGKKVDSIRPEYKKENGSVTHMVCIFVSFDQDFISAEGAPADYCCPPCTAKECRLRTAKKQPPFVFLCSSVLQELTMSCEINNCPSPHRRSPAWKYFVEEVVTTLEPRKVSTTTEQRNDTGAPSPKDENYRDRYMRNVYRRKNCKILILLFLLTLTVLCLAWALFYKHLIEKKIYTR